MQVNNNINSSSSSSSSTTKEINSFFGTTVLATLLLLLIIIMGVVQVSQYDELLQHTFTQIKEFSQITQSVLSKDNFVSYRVNYINKKIQLKK